MGLFDKLKKNKDQQNNLTVPEEQSEFENKVAETKNKELDLLPVTEITDTAEQLSEPAADNAKKKGMFGRLKAGLGRTRDSFTSKIDRLIGSGRKLDEDFFEEMEEILIQADVGVNTTLELVDQLRKAAKSNRLKDTTEVKGLLKQLMIDIMGEEKSKLAAAEAAPTVILVVGVNGVGKTTTIAKLAYRFKTQGNKVILAAGDTFRAAAIDQLQIWADRVGVEMIRQGEGADPAAVVFDAIAAARSRRADYLIIDTAGRLHNKANLMQEIAKVRRVIDREIPGAPHECLLVLDATTGQNAIAQARQFNEATRLTGLVLTKLDGTAKGGITVAVARELEIPVKLIGIGEQMDDLREFVPGEFIEALFATGQE
ncbi:MAG: signal recognition particle-docking protein FtsY [Methylocystaceae bacterium]